MTRRKQRRNKWPTEENFAAIVILEESFNSKELVNVADWA